MDHLSESLRLAAAEPPPTGIDVDGLIEGEHRARRRRQWFAAGGAAALVMVAVVGTAAVAGGLVPGSAGYGVGGAGYGVGGAGPAATSAKPDPGGQPEALGQCIAVLPTPTSATGPSDPGEPAVDNAPTLKPAPTEPRKEAILRLSTVLNRVLPATLPGANFADEVHPNCAKIQFTPDIYPALYYAGIAAKDAAGIGSITVMIYQAREGAENDFGSGQEPGSGLYDSHEVRPDGTRVGWLSAAPGVGGHNQVGVLRPDGTYLTLFSQNPKHPGDTNPIRPTPPATVEQLIAIGTDPGLTLYP